MMTDEELEAALAETLQKVYKDISEWLPVDMEPMVAKDANGRYLLLDAYAALAILRAARLSQDGQQIKLWGQEKPFKTIPDVKRKE